MRIVAFEPYDAGSHRAVRESLSRHSRHDWTWLTRPGRGWKWRTRLAAAEFIAALDQPVAAAADVVFATSLMSLADLRALWPGPRVPFVLYMHENQAVYPHAPQETDLSRLDTQPAFTNLTSILAADCVLWNSHWNLESFIDGMRPLLRAAPDFALPDWEATIRDRSRIAWPPVETAGLCQIRSGPAGNRVLWPHRWEHDKDPDELLAVAEHWTAELGLRWTILGQAHQTVPPALETFGDRFAGSIDFMGYAASRDEYIAHLRSADWVLSTARHEFFGIAVTEALLAGCLPWLPERLSYPELVPPESRGLSPATPPADADAHRAAIAGHLEPAAAPAAVRHIDDTLDAARPTDHPHHVS